MRIHKLLGVEVGPDLDVVIGQDPGLRMVDRIIEDGNDYHLVLSQKYQRTGARASSDREITFVVENILTPGEFAGAVFRARATKRRR